MRCCYENLFYIAGIAQDGDKFIRKMLDDELATRRDRGERLLASDVIEKGGEVEERLRSYLKGINQKGRKLTPKGAADNSAVANGYPIYMQVSADSAHPTLTSLSRHVLQNRKTGEIDELNIVPIADAEEIIETLDFACGALLGVCYGAVEVLGGNAAATEIRSRLDELQRLKGMVGED